MMSTGKRTLSRLLLLLLVLANPLQAVMAVNMSVHAQQGHNQLHYSQHDQMQHDSMMENDMQDCKTQCASCVAAITDTSHCQHAAIISTPFQNPQQTLVDSTKARLERPPRS